MIGVTAALPPNIGAEIRRGATLEGLFERQRTLGNPLEDPRIVQHLRAIHFNAQISRVETPEFEDKQAIFDRLKQRIKAYNKKIQLTFFQISIDAEESGQLDYSGVLRFYLENANGQEQVKAIRLRGTDTVKDIIPSLLDKFYLSHEEKGPAYNKKLYQVINGDAVLLDPDDKPLEVALTATRNPRFVLRLKPVAKQNGPGFIKPDVITDFATSINIENRRSPLLRGEINANYIHREYRPSELAEKGKAMAETNDKAFAGQPEPRRSTVRRQKRRDQEHERRSMRSLKSPVLKASFRRGFSLRQKSVEDLKKSQTELSTEETSPGLLKIFGDSICPGAHYKSVLASNNSTAKELVKEALERYGVDKSSAADYVLCDVIGKLKQETDSPEEGSTWTMECLRVIGDNERPLILQSFWKPDEGFCRRFELHTKLEVTSYDDVDTTTHGLNANARKMLIMHTRQEAMPKSNKENFLRELAANEKPKIFRSTPDLCSADKSSDVSNTQVHMGHERQSSQSGVSETSTYSVRPPVECPYFITLRGYDLVNDFVVYPFHEQITLIGSGPSGEVKLDILLTAPDILSRHCWVCQDLEDSPQHVTIKPFTGATVQVNGALVSVNGMTLRPGDIVTLGSYYVFLFKDPVIMAEIPRNLPWLTSMRAQPSSPLINRTNVEPQNSSPSEDLPSPAKPQPPCSIWRKQKRREYETDNTRLKLSYSLDQEGFLIERIMDTMESSPRPYPLCPSYLFAMTLEYAAVTYDQVHLRALLLKISTAMQGRVWGKAKYVSDRQPQRPIESPTYIQDVLNDLEPVVIWLNNSVEFYQFVQDRQSDLLLDVDKALPPGTRDSIVSAENESLALLEDVVMYGFQQTVYYITKALYLSLPAVLECNPFADGDIMHDDHPRATGTVQSMVNTFQAAYNMFRRLIVHEDLIRSLFSYLFFFVNTSLFNSLMDRDVGHKYYKWSKGVQIRGNMDAIDGWAADHNLQEIAANYLAKINGLANLLATPKLQLQLADWKTLHRDNPALSKAQLHKVLSEYQLGNDAVIPERWLPSDEELSEIGRDADLSESFNNHPPLHIPSEGFMLNLYSDIDDQSFHDVLHDIRSLLGEKDDDVDSGLSVSHMLPHSPNSPSGLPGHSQDSGGDSMDKTAQKGNHNPLKISPTPRMFTVGYRTDSFRAATAEKDSEDSGNQGSDFDSSMETPPSTNSSQYKYEPKANGERYPSRKSSMEGIPEKDTSDTNLVLRRPVSNDFDPEQPNINNVISMDNWSLGKPQPRTNGKENTGGIRCVRAPITRPKVPPPVPTIPPKPAKRNPPSPTSNLTSWPHSNDLSETEKACARPPEPEPRKGSRRNSNEALPLRKSVLQVYQEGIRDEDNNLKSHSPVRGDILDIESPAVERKQEQERRLSRDLSRERLDTCFPPIEIVPNAELTVEEPVVTLTKSPSLSARMRMRTAKDSPVQQRKDFDKSEGSPVRHPNGNSKGLEQRRIGFRDHCPPMPTHPPPIPPFRSNTVQHPDSDIEEAPPALPPRTRAGSSGDTRRGSLNPFIGNVAAKRNLFMEGSARPSHIPRPSSAYGGYTPPSPKPNRKAENGQYDTPPSNKNHRTPSPSASPSASRAKLTLNIQSENQRSQSQSPSRSPVGERRFVGTHPSPSVSPRGSPVLPQRSRQESQSSDGVPTSPMLHRDNKTVREMPFAYPITQEGIHSPDRQRKVHNGPGPISNDKGQHIGREENQPTYVDVGHGDRSQPNGLRVLPVTTESSQLHSPEEQGISADQAMAGNDDDAVFVVDLERGEKGIGLGLIDGLFTPLRKAGIYVRTIVPGGNAEKDGRLRLGDRILAVNGTSVVGADYNSAMKVIKSSGRDLRFLVAKSDTATAFKLSGSNC